MMMSNEHDDEEQEDIYIKHNNGCPSLTLGNFKEGDFGG